MPTYKSPATVNLILEDINKNGPIAQAIERIVAKVLGRRHEIPSGLTAADIAQIIVQDIERSGPLSRILQRAIVDWIDRGAIRIRT